MVKKGKLFNKMGMCACNKDILQPFCWIWGRHTKTQNSRLAQVSCNVIMQILYPETLGLDFIHEDKRCTTGLGTPKIWGACCYTSKWATGGRFTKQLMSDFAR